MELSVTVQRMDLDLLSLNPHFLYPKEGSSRGKDIILISKDAKSQVVERLVVSWSDVNRLNKRDTATTLINISDRFWEEMLSLI